MAELLYNGEVLSISEERDLSLSNESLGPLMSDIDDRLKPAKGNEEESKEIAKELKSKNNIVVTLLKKIIS
ncbi:hypothetical protein [Campylobacter sp. 2018MI13]|uniref:hypothetical protein n=1 Tax=Campylobacter sp. 2018MI13 TaxID=2836737 RepID=UPI001BDB2D4D|nr:hypothetical protein [Campylobacter sp. 2018MI13]MBT0883558.1 hypothetical protein [Campylobacter sp. 2018MI13]